MLITHRELLALSSDVRKKHRELVTGRRIPSAAPANAATVLYADSADPAPNNGLVVAVNAAPLRAITATLDNKHSVECIIDGGSSIVAMQKSLWEKIGSPMRSDYIMTMQSSHGGVRPTLGVLKDFPLTIGPCTFYVQMQISDTLPADVLIGRPFFMLTDGHTVDHSDGSQELVLHDPNTGDQITVPTHERNPRGRNPDVQVSGF